MKSHHFLHVVWEGQVLATRSSTGARLGQHATVCVEGEDQQMASVLRDLLAGKVVCKEGEELKDRK